jgi:hypothetical protein
MASTRIVQYRGQKTEVGGQMTEYRGQRTEDRGQNTEDRNWKISIRSITFTFDPIHYALCHSP